MISLLFWVIDNHPKTLVFIEYEVSRFVVNCCTALSKMHNGCHYIYISIRIHILDYYRTFPVTLMWLSSVLTISTWAIIKNVPDLWKWKVTMKLFLIVLSQPIKLIGPKIMIEPHYLVNMNSKRKPISWWLPITQLLFDSKQEGTTQKYAFTIINTLLWW